MSSSNASHNRRVFPLWIKAVWCCFVALHLYVNLSFYGPLNYLWFCDIALLTATIALCLENRLLLSMTVLSTMVIMLAWSTDFLCFVFTGHFLNHLGIAAYMSDHQIPLIVRAVSTFHIMLPVLLIWMMSRLGYDRRALVYQTVFAIALLIICRMMTAPPPPHSVRDVVNINSVYGNSDVAPQTKYPAWIFICRIIVKYWLVAYLPTHLIAGFLFDRRPRRERHGFPMISSVPTSAK